MSNVTKIQICIGNQGDEDREFLEYVCARYPSTEVTLEHCGHMRCEVDCDEVATYYAVMDSLSRLWDEYCNQL